MDAAYKESQLLLQVELWIFLCLITACLFALRGRFLPSRRFLLLGALLFYAASIGPVAKAVMSPLESWYPPYLSERDQSYDAVVVLSGALQWQGAMGSYTIFGTESLDRLICGINIFKKTSTPLLVLAGGVPDAVRPTPAVATVMKDQALRLGIPPNAILTETRSRTTAENAVEVRRLLPDAQRIVLTTSASHLPRAIAVFKKQGFPEVTPAPCYYEVTDNDFVVTDLIPSHDNMRLVDYAIHEYMGILIYRALERL